MMPRAGMHKQNRKMQSESGRRHANQIKRNIWFSYSGIRRRRSAEMQPATGRGH